MYKIQILYTYYGWSRFDSSAYTFGTAKEAYKAARNIIRTFEGTDNVETIYIYHGDELIAKVQG